METFVVDRQRDARAGSCRSRTEESSESRSPHRITAVIVNFNGIRTILNTIRSLLSMADVDCEIIVLDDGSTDGSPEAIERSFPQVRVEKEPCNTRHVNRLRSKGLALASTREVLLTDNDIVFDPDCGRRLLTVMVSDPAVGACMPRLMAMDDRERVYNGGARTHYLGTTIASHRDSEGYTTPSTPVPAVGGGVALFDMKKLQHVGSFDEDYELAWGDDGELHQRLLLAGYKCVLVPDAVGFHEYKPFDRSRHYRARGQIRNRWRFIGTHYSGRTLGLIVPALAIYEIVQAAFYLIRGVPHLYVLGTFDALRDIPAIARRRKVIQALRVVPDNAVLFAGPIYIRADHSSAQPIVRSIVHMISWFFSAYWSAIQAALDNGAPFEPRQRVL